MTKKDLKDMILYMALINFAQLLIMLWLFSDDIVLKTIAFILIIISILIDGIIIVYWLVNRYG